jgi:malonate-semialdehyde dehydrogenase (acetylating)/methylmalonate-semialdehyde dehydrogenase
MSEYKQLISRDIKKLAEIVSVEHGKTLDDAIGSITRGLEVVEFSCGIPHLLKGEFSSNVGTDIDSWSTRQPLGICAGITPFNFPAMVPMWMYPMAIACGNSFILKPSEKNPSCALELARLFTEAGLPDGVLNILNGDKNVVNFLIKDENISSLSFVGSTPVAKYIYSESAKYGKRVQALGGAKNHLVVMPDANIQTAVDGVIGAAYGASGERCMAVSVAVAVGDIADELVENIKIKAEQLKVAPWTNDESEMGPLISLEHKEKVINYITQGENEGADLLSGVNFDHSRNPL